MNPNADGSEDSSSLSAATRALIDAALAEDVGPGDWTTLWTVPADSTAEARIMAKAPGVVAGIAVAEAVFRRIDSDLILTRAAEDGARVAPGDLLLRTEGRSRSILTAERVALNFLQRLSGVATATRRYVDAVAGTGVRLLDTRKTTPGMRALEKDAVRAGGAANHRFGLHDMILLKENHLAATGGITAAVAAVRLHNAAGLAIEVETTTLDEVDEALEAGVERILFDNMPVSLLRQAVARVAERGAGRPETEASGGITLDTIRAVAETGVDFISVGALTHSAPALDLSLQLHPR